MNSENVNTIPGSIAVETEIANFFVQFAKTVAVWKRRSGTRRTLAAASNHILTDIGISEAEREAEIKKFFWEE